MDNNVNEQDAPKKSSLLGTAAVAGVGGLTGYKTYTHFRDKHANLTTPVSRDTKAVAGALAAEQEAVFSGAKAAHAKGFNGDAATAGKAFDEGTAPILKTYLNQGKEAAWDEFIQHPKSSGYSGEELAGRFSRLENALEGKTPLADRVAELKSLNEVPKPEVAQFADKAGFKAAQGHYDAHAALQKANSAFETAAKKLAPDQQGEAVLEGLKNTHGVTQAENTLDRAIASRVLKEPKLEKSFGEAAGKAAKSLEKVKLPNGAGRVVGAVVAGAGAAYVARSVLNGMSPQSHVEQLRMSEGTGGPAVG